MSKIWKTTAIIKSIDGGKPNKELLMAIEKKTGGTVHLEGIFRDRPTLYWRELSDFDKLLSVLCDDPKVGTFQLLGAGGLKGRDPFKGVMIPDASKPGASYATMNFNCEPLRFDHQRQGRLYSASVQLFDENKLPCAGSTLRDFWYRALLSGIPDRWEIHLSERTHIPTVMLHKISKTELSDVIKIINTLQGVEMFKILAASYDRQTKPFDGHVKTTGFNSTEDFERTWTTFDLPTDKLKEMEKLLNQADNQANQKAKEKIFNNE